MSACVKFLTMALVLSCGCVSALAANHPVPKDRAALTNRDWLPHVISKIAPLEWWSFAASPAEISREDYPSDYDFEQAKLEIFYFPRVCFSLFRPKADPLPALIKAANEYSGDVKWQISDGCIEATPFKETFTAPPAVARGERQPVPLQTDPEFVKKAVNDCPRFAAWLEEKLGLVGKPSLAFDSSLLTSEGLAASRPQFEDYWEPGSWPVFLVRKPRQYAEKPEPTSTPDRPVSMGVAGYQKDALFNELSPGWEAFQDKDPVIPAYPMLSRLSDLTADALYERHEVDALLDECLQAQARVKNPDALRGLDNVVRIARWAQKLKLGIYFGAQNP
jgi:hypothetical protein